MTQETHKALKLADQLTCHPVSRGIEEIEQAGAIIRQQHGLIVQMAHVFEGEHFEHDDQRQAIAACAQYLKAKP